MSGDRTYLGFDFGRARIGVAAGQEVTAGATALTTLSARGGEPDWRQLDRLVDEWRPAALVVGVPLHLDGREQPVTRAARAFAARLEERYGLPVHAADERLSSRAAGAAIATARRAGHGRRTRKGDVDRISAQLILEDWLARRSGDGD